MSLNLFVYLYCHSGFVINSIKFEFTDDEIIEEQCQFCSIALLVVAST